jgi:opacity protein-like surface antigen
LEKSGGDSLKQWKLGVAAKVNEAHNGENIFPRAWGRMKNIIGLLLLAGATCAQAGPSTGAAWLGMPTDARSAALAGAVGAWNEGVDSFAVNPSGLAATRDTEALLTHAFWAQDVSREHLGVAHRVGDKWSLGLSADYVGYGNIDGFTVVNNVPVANGTIKPYDLAVGLGCGVKLSPHVMLGAQAKMLREDLGGTNGSMAAGDLGCLFSNRGWKIGASVLNVGGELNGASLPTTGTLSASYKIQLTETTKTDKTVRQELGVMAQGEWELKGDQQTAAGAGVEYRYADTLALRAGYRGASYDELTGLKGLTAGVGVTVKKLELSYALVTLGDFGKSNLLSLKASF